MPGREQGECKVMPHISLEPWIHFSFLGRIHKFSLEIASLNPKNSSREREFATKMNRMTWDGVGLGGAAARDSLEAVEGAEGSRVCAHKRRGVLRP